ncbi:site-specific integrase [Thiotrichales bacterium 19X7-9]|nr:site-specific integrase [Thiotrichales bacterium 19X7-9]
MPKIKLTKTSISAIQSTNSIVDYFDTEVKGLVLRVFPSGAKTFTVIYRNNEKKLKRYTIGRYPTLPLAMAKKEAQRLLLQVSQGQDIQKLKVLTQRPEKYSYKDYINGFYINWCQRNVKHARSIELILLNTCKPLHQFELKEINQVVLNRFLTSYQAKNKVSNGRINRIMNTVKGSISRAYEHGYIENNTLQGLKTLKESVAKVRYLSKSETKKLFKALEDTDEFIKNIVLTAYYTGMRRGEIFSLKWEDVDLTLNQIILDKNNTKSGKIRDIPINSKLRKIFINLPTCKSGLIFKSPITNTKLDNINKSWATLMDKAQIENFRFHDLRHNFASQLVMKGENLSVVRELLGHSDFKMTLRYAHLAPEHKQKAVDLL